MEETIDGTVDEEFGVLDAGMAKGGLDMPVWMGEGDVVFITKERDGAGRGILPDPAAGDRGIGGGRGDEGYTPRGGSPGRAAGSDLSSGLGWAKGQR